MSVVPESSPRGTIGTKCCDTCRFVKLNGRVSRLCCHPELKVWNEKKGAYVAVKTHPKGDGETCFHYKVNIYLEASHGD